MSDNKTLWLDDPKQHIKVACRLCGDVWKFPIAYASSFKDAPTEGWECPNCRRTLEMWGRR